MRAEFLQLFYESCDIINSIILFSTEFSRHHFLMNLIPENILNSTFPQTFLSARLQIFNPLLNYFSIFMFKSLIYHTTNISVQILYSIYETIRLFLMRFKIKHINTTL